MLTEAPSFPGASPRSKPRSIQRLVCLLFLLSLCSALFPVSVSWAKERIRKVSVEISDGKILVSARLSGGFSRKVVKDIQNGIPKDFYYYILLKKKERNWFDEEVLSRTLRYRVKYDTLKKTYSVLEDIEGRETGHHFERFEKMKDKVSNISRVALASVSVLKQNRRYYVSVKSQMQASRRPFYLDYFLFFIPFLEVDTPWADSAQIVPAKTLPGGQ